MSVGLPRIARRWTPLRDLHLKLIVRMTRAAITFGPLRADEQSKKGV